MDDRSAEATLTDGRLSMTTRVRFGADGLIASMSADERIRAVTEGVMTTAPGSAGYRTTAGSTA